MPSPRIKRYVGRRGKRGLLGDEMRVDAIIWNLEVIGEAAGRFPKVMRKDFPDVPWQKLVGLRNVLIHGYNGIDMDIVWDIVKNRLPELEAALRRR